MPRRPARCKVRAPGLSPRRLLKNPNPKSSCKAISLSEQGDFREPCFCSVPQFPPLDKAATVSMAGATQLCEDRIPKQLCLSAGSAKPHGAEGWAYLGLEGATGLWGNHKASSLAPSFADLSSQGEGSIPCFSGPLSTTAKWGMTQVHSRGFPFQNPESQQDKHWALSLKSLGAGSGGARL